MRKTLIMLSLFFAIILCTFHTSIVAQDPGNVDVVRFLPWGTYVPCPPCTGRAVVPMVVAIDESLRVMAIPLYWTGPIRLDTAIFVGQRSELMSLKYCYIDNYYKTVLLTGGSSQGEALIPPGDGILIYLYFTVLDTGTVTVDTISNPPDMYYFYDNSGDPIMPFFYSSESRILPNTTFPGDANFDGHTTISDVVWLINYLFKGGPPPSYLPSGDVNTDGEITVADVIYFINYLFKGGPCLGEACYY